MVTVNSDAESLKLSWLHERVDSVPKGNWLYRLICTVFFRRKRKFTYLELYAMLWRINKGKLGDDMAKKFALSRIIQMYRHLNNNQNPEGV